MLAAGESNSPMRTWAHVIFFVAALSGCMAGIGRPGEIEADEELGGANARRAAPAPTCACAREEVCCNPSCGICARPDEPCAATACE